MKRIAEYIAICSVPIFLVGCDSKGRDLVTASNGLVYRINKQNGEVSPIVGAQITRLDEFRGSNTEGLKKLYLRDWPVQKVKSLGDISLHLKTTWREGKLHYILSVSPLSSQVQTAKETARKLVSNSPTL
jgi:hypothetical protein